VARLFGSRVAQSLTYFSYRNMCDIFAQATGKRLALRGPGIRSRSCLVFV